MRPCPGGSGAASWLAAAPISERRRPRAPCVPTPALAKLQGASATCPSCAVCCVPSVWVFQVLSW
eukprot:6021685-Prymnesium_polylepis.1